MPIWSTYLDKQQSRFIDELKDFLRIPSISALSEHNADVRAAGEWVSNRLRRAGMENIQLIPTAGHPLVYADWLHAEDKPTIMIYGHFDVQPVDPLDLWTHPPFDPLVKGDRIYARGASDDKGNMLAPILALEALLETSGSLPVNVKCLFEGQEEVGSPDLSAVVEAKKEQLRCDFVLSADGGQWGEDQPSVLLSLRGMAGMQIDVYGPRSDQHSGLYGGAIQNPIHALVQLLDSMRSPDGRVLVEGFYDNITPLGKAQREEIARIPFDEAALKKTLGLEEQGLFGEAGYSTYERRWIRPTLEINGIWGGFQGEGTKTVIPALAHAKITCRLVADQDPDRIMDCIDKHIRRQRKPGVRVKTIRFDGNATAYSIPPDHPGNKVAFRVLKELYGRRPLYIRSGGSIPILTILKQVLEVDTVSFSFALYDENFHAPDEFFRLTSFKKAQTAYCMYLEALEKSGD